MLRETVHLFTSGEDPIKRLSINSKSQIGLLPLLAETTEGSNSMSICLVQS